MKITLAWLACLRLLACRSVPFSRFLIYCLPRLGVLITRYPRKKHALLTARKVRPTMAVERSGCLRSSGGGAVNQMNLCSSVSGGLVELVLIARPLAFKRKHAGGRWWSGIITQWKPTKRRAGVVESVLGRVTSRAIKLGGTSAQYRGSWTTAFEACGMSGLCNGLLVSAFAPLELHGSALRSYVVHCGAQDVDLLQRQGSHPALLYLGTVFRRITFGFPLLS